MQKVASVSLMFDEASDIQMYKHLNIFVNVSAYNLFFSQYVVLLYFCRFHAMLLYFILSKGHYYLCIVSANFYVGATCGNGGGQNSHPGT